MKTFSTSKRAPKATERSVHDDSPVIRVKYPIMHIKLIFDGDILRVFHSKTEEPAPHIAALFEAVAIKDVNPFNIIDQEAYDHYHAPRIFTMNMGTHYLYIPDTDENRATCMSVSSARGLRMDLIGN